MATWPHKKAMEISVLFFQQRALEIMSGADVIRTFGSLYVEKEDGEEGREELERARASNRGGVCDGAFRLAEPAFLLDSSISKANRRRSKVRCRCWHAVANVYNDMHMRAVVVTAQILNASCVRPSKIGRASKCSV